MESEDNSDDHPNIIKTFEGFKPKIQGLGWELFISMKRYKRNIAQYLADSGEEETYELLLSRCVKCAIKLRSKQLGQGAIIYMCSNNHKNSAVPFIAANFLGMKSTTLDPSICLEDAIHLLKQVTPSIIFVIPSALELIEGVVGALSLEIEIVVFGQTENHVNFDDFLEDSDEETSFVPAKANSRETAVIFFSSGTTGLPKGICCSHYGLLCQSLNIGNSGGISAVSLSYTTLYWISSVSLLIGTIISGCARVIVESFNATETWLILQDYKVTNAFFSPFQAAELVRCGRPNNIDTSNLLSLFTGGAKAPNELIYKLRDLLPGTFVYQAYGQTEMSGVVTTFKIHDPRDRILLNYRPESCGRPLEGIWYKVVDPDTDEVLGPNQQGELRLKSDYIMNGYYDRDSSSTFDSAGWLMTGDVVYYDEDQCFYIIDRIKDLMKFQSWHVPPALIEGVLHQHPAVDSAVVIGIPHEIDGDHPMALVIVKDEFNDSADPAEIEQFVADRVQDRQKLRAGVKFIDSIPLTPTGKIRRNYIRDLVISGEI